MEYQSYEQILANPGDTPPADSGAESTPALEASDSTDEVAAITGQGDAIADATDEATTDSDQETEEKSEGAGDENEPSSETELTLEQIDQALKDSEQGKKIKRPFFEASISHLKTKLTERETALQTFEQAGTPEDVAKYREFYDEFHGFDQSEDGNFVPKVTKFAERVLSESPDKAIEMINTLVTSPYPYNPNQTVFQAMIETPEVEAYFAKKFEAQADPVLEEVPSEYQDAYRNLDPALKESFEILDEAAQKAALMQSQRDLDNKKRDQEFQVRKQQETQAQFQQLVDTTREESFGTVLSQFEESLKVIPFAPDSDLSAFLQNATQDLVITAATMSSQKAGQQAIETLKKVGIQFPADVPTLVNSLEQYSAHLATAKSQRNDQAAKYYAAEIATAQKRLIARTNEISAQVAKRFGTAAKDASTQKANLLSQSKTRPEINPTSGQQSPNARYLSPAEIVAMG